MELINATSMVAGYNVGLEPGGRELLVVVIKGTFALPRAGEAVRLADQQLPLVMADTFTGEPGASAPLHEVDFAPRKGRCDVLLIGSAHAPAGREVTRMRVGLRVGPMEKTFDVVGDRVWQYRGGQVAASAPQPFASRPVSYDTAFGGVDCYSAVPAEHDAFLPNPVGRGWHKHVKRAWVDGSPLPNTEAIGRVVSHPSHHYEPMALGSVGRGWSQRARFTGTYGERWLAEVFPFLPADFDARYHQAAPVDQQVQLPHGPMEVMLSGFTADGMRHFLLPHFEAPIRVFQHSGVREDLSAVLDTIVFEPDHELFTMTWRASRALRRDVFEIAKLIAGRHTPRIQGQVVCDPEVPEAARSAHPAAPVETL